MSVQGFAVTVTTTPTVLATGSATDYAAGSSVLVTNNSGATIYIGGPDVNATLGTPVAAAAQVSVDLATGSILYGFVASSTANVRILQEG